MSIENRQKKRKYRRYRFNIIVAGLIIIGFTLILGNLNNILMAQYEMNNKLMEVENGF